MAVNRHFWNLNETSALEIAKIAEKGPEYGLEDVTRHAWQEIACTYFPFRSATVGGPLYSVQLERYRGLPPAEVDSQKPYIAVIRLQNIQQQQGMPPSASERDILWVEFKAPCHDNPTRWKDVIAEAVKRLSAAHSVRRVYLILAIGLKWMPFLWDPTAPTLNPAGSPLHILKDNQQDTWAVDPRIHMIAPVNLQGQTHVFQHNGAWIVDTRLAYSLDFWTLDQSGNPANLPEMLLLENLFALIRATQYQGDNPPEF